MENQSKMKIFKTILLLLIIFAASACNPAKQLARLQKNNPYLFTNAKDTILIIDTIPITVPGSKVDSSFHASRLQFDTLKIVNNYSYTTIYQANDSLHVENEEKEFEIEVPYEKEVEVDKYILPEVPKESNFLTWIIIVLLVALLVIQFFKQK